MNRAEVRFDPYLIKCESQECRGPRTKRVPGDDEDFIRLGDFAMPVANANFDCPATLQEMQKKSRMLVRELCVRRQ